MSHRSATLRPRATARRGRPAAHRRPNTRLPMAPFRARRQRCDTSAPSPSTTSIVPTSSAVASTSPASPLQAPRPEMRPDEQPARPRTRRPAHPATAVAATGSGRRWMRVVLIAELVLLALLLTAAAGPVALAAGPTVATNVTDVFNNIRNWLMGILAGLATVFLTLAGVRYLMGAGDPGEIEKAKTALKAAAIGFCLAALAPVVVSILQGLVA